MVVLTNFTKYETEDLRAFIQEALEIYKGKSIAINVRPGKKWVRVLVGEGGAYFITLPAPKHGAPSGELERGSKRTLARLVWWVINYQAGFRGRALKRWRKVAADWTADMVIRVQQVAVKPRQQRLDEIKAKRAKAARKTLELAEARIADLERRLKRVRKALAKAKQRVRYYDKQDLECDLVQRIQKKLGPKSE